MPQHGEFIERESRFDGWKLPDCSVIPELCDCRDAIRFRMKMLHQMLPILGRKLFPFRMLIGIIVVLIALEWICPTPFFGRDYRLIHMAAILVIFTGLALRAWGAGSAGGHTRSGQIEAPRLATGGPFAYVRNPIYTGSMLIGLGMSMLMGDPKAFAFAACVFAFLFLAIVPAEEDFLVRQFGEEYLEYRQSVPRLIPRLTPWHGQSKTRFQWHAVRGELVIMLLLATIYGAFVAEEYLDKIFGS
jgi:protein-S-isoprenylcysteine O-methyltransferase Ste14